MVTLANLLSDNSAELLNVIPGTILLGEMKGVDHLKFFVVAGVSDNRVCVCSVIINSSINSFIMRRPHLLSRQVQLKCEDYRFLSHDSYINCAQPLKGGSDFFKGCKRVGLLRNEDLQLVREEIIKSGTLTSSELSLYNLL